MSAIGAARERGAGRRAGDRLLADRRVDDPVVPELLDEADVDAERAAEAALDADVLADQEHGLVAAHLLGTASRSACAIVSRRVAVSGVDIAEQLRGIGVGGVARELDGLVQLAFDVGVDRGGRVLGSCARSRAIGSRSFHAASSSFVR
jgi:hypothetical protein